MTTTTTTNNNGSLLLQHTLGIPCHERADQTILLGGWSRSSSSSSGRRPQPSDDLPRSRLLALAVVREQPPRLVASPAMRGTRKVRAAGGDAEFHMREEALRLGAVAVGTALPGQATILGDARCSEEINRGEEETKSAMQ